ncbi:MAG TPA: Rieske 2Fe-2S domain-containing protein [Solirubrobacteraceae bacterium]|nr:Rieske 2Fe-2S domain-containing protein [Solirubrobacteraceae bacterium]
MRGLGRWLLGLVVVALGFLRDRGPEGRKRIVEPGESAPRAELVVIALLLLAALFAVGFIVVYALDRIGNQTQLLGVTLGACLLLLATALIIVGKHLVVSEEVEQEYHEQSPVEQEQVAQIVRESGSRFTRKRLIKGAAGTAGVALGLAAVTPALTLGPFLDVDPFYSTPWKRGRRLVDKDGKPYLASDIEQETFYTAFPQGASQDTMGAPLVLVRMDPRALKLPKGREGWAPQGILAYSKICTHAGCAISLYRKPTFAPVQPRPSLVCPCHYSTFDPATGGNVLFGPAGRPLPQLPLMIDAAGVLRAAGDFSGPIGPSWWGVREGKAN